MAKEICIFIIFSNKIKYAHTHTHTRNTLSSIYNVVLCREYKFIELGLTCIYGTQVYWENGTTSVYGGWMEGVRPARPVNYNKHDFIASRIEFVTQHMYRMESMSSVGRTATLYLWIRGENIIQANYIIGMSDEIYLRTERYITGRCCHLVDHLQTGDRHCAISLNVTYNFF